MTLYGLIDCARHDALYLLVSAEREHECLFAGDLSPTLRAASPHIVTIDEGSALLKHWRETGWGDHWGILCVSTEPLKAVRKQFRKLQQAMLPDGDVVLFRFFDPRVWNTYIPTCGADDLAKWFGVVQEYRAPSADGSSAINYRFDGNQLVSREYPIGSAPAQQALGVSFDEKLRQREDAEKTVIAR